jgi:hypothetical protein
VAVGDAGASSFLISDGAYHVQLLASISVGNPSRPSFLPTPCSATNIGNAAPQQGARLTELMASAACWQLLRIKTVQLRWWYT